MTWPGALTEAGCTEDPNVRLLWRRSMQLASSSGVRLGGTLKAALRVPSAGVRMGPGAGSRSSHAPPSPRSLLRKGPTLPGFGLPTTQLRMGIAVRASTPRHGGRKPTAETGHVRVHSAMG